MQGALMPLLASVTLKWDRPPDRTVKGFRIHYGTTHSRNYSQTVDVGKATSCKLSNLVPGKKYYFVVTSYNASRKESPPSLEAPSVATGEKPREN
jgi:Fibronectin type III domain